MAEALVLATVCLVLAVINAVLCAGVPFLLWKYFKLEQQIEKLDEVVAELCEAAGLGKEQKEGRH